jgi:hypothetical protein
MNPSTPVPSLVLMYPKFEMKDKCMMTEDGQQLQVEGMQADLHYDAFYLRDSSRSIVEDPTLLWSRNRLECCHLLWLLLTDFIAACCCGCCSLISQLPAAVGVAH